MVGLAAAVWLDICKLTAEELFAAINRDLFNLIYELAAAVVALAGIALGVFVR